MLATDVKSAEFRIDGVEPIIVAVAFASLTANVEDEKRSHMQRKTQLLGKRLGNNYSARFTLPACPQYNEMELCHIINETLFFPFMNDEPVLLPTEGCSIVYMLKPCGGNKRQPGSTSLIEHDRKRQRAPNVEHADVRNPYVQLHCNARLWRNTLSASAL